MHFGKGEGTPQSQPTLGGESQNPPASEARRDVLLDLLRSTDEHIGLLAGPSNSNQEERKKKRKQTSVLPIIRSTSSQKE